MITYRVEIQFLEETKILDIWKAFCDWRRKSKHCNPTEKIWFDENSEILRSENIFFKSDSRHGSSQITRIYNEKRKILAIQYVQYETKKDKIFTTTIVVNLGLAEPAMSHVMEESPLSDEEFHEKKGFTKPNLFQHIESFVDKKYVPCDPFGKPKPFTPCIYVSNDISEIQIEALREKYRHTANIRTQNDECLVDESDLKELEKHIVSRKNMEFVCRELTWNYVMANLSASENAAISKMETIEREISRPIRKHPNVTKKPNENGQKKIIIRRPDLPS